MKKLATLLLPLLLAACASAPVSLPSDNVVAPSFHAPAAGAMIVLLPPVVDTQELTAGADKMMQQLYRQLSAAGYKAAALDAANYHSIWAEEVQAVGGIYDAASGQPLPEKLARAQGELVKRVSAETKAAVVMRPSLDLRTASLTGSWATWDGQRRQVPVVNAGFTEYRHNGNTRALSVGLEMFAANGNKVVSTHGGASLVYQINVLTGKAEVRKDLFYGDSELADAIALALQPFLQTR